MNYYQILEVSKNASEKEIRASYKKLIKQYHPDIYKGNKSYAEKITMDLNNAYATLSDAEKRAEYDLSLLPPSPQNNSYTNTQTSSYNYNNYKQSYTQTYSEPIEEEKENWNQKFKKKLYDFVDEHTKNLNYKTRAMIVVIIILTSLIFTLLSVIDYLKVTNTKTEKEIMNNINTILQENNNIQNNLSL